MLHLWGHLLSAQLKITLKCNIMSHFLAKYIVVANASTGNSVHHWTNVTKHLFLLAGGKQMNDNKREQPSSTVISAAVWGCTAPLCDTNPVKRSYTLAKPSPCTWLGHSITAAVSRAASCSLALGASVSRERLTLWRRNTSSWAPCMSAALSCAACRRSLWWYPQPAARLSFGNAFCNSHHPCSGYEIRCTRTP